jgi:hypothetical protein
VGGERVDLAWHGTNHTPDNTYIHFPDHDTLMLVDINLPRWVPFDSFNLNEDVPGSIAAPDTAMAYPWKHFIGGHMGRLGTRRDMVIYQQYVTDIIVNVKKALVNVDPTPFFAKYGDNAWAAVKEYQAAQVAYASAPVIKKYTGVLAAADVYTASTTFVILDRSAWTSVWARRSTPDLGHAGGRSGPALRRPAPDHPGQHPRRPGTPGRVGRRGSESPMPWRRTRRGQVCLP